MPVPSTLLVVAIAAFVVMLLWRVRPSFGPGRRGGRAALKEVQARIEAAPDEPSRALALCDAGDLVARRIAGSASAQGLFMRAMRADPSSVDVIARTVAGLSKRPRALESVLWRHLGSGSWSGPSRGAMVASLDALRALYEGPLRNAVRARALANARDAASTAGSSGTPARAAQPGGQKTVGSV